MSSSELGKHIPERPDLVLGLRKSFLSLCCYSRYLENELQPLQVRADVACNRPPAILQPVQVFLGFCPKLFLFHLLFGKSFCLIILPFYFMEYSTRMLLLKTVFPNLTYGSRSWTPWFRRMASTHLSAYTSLYMD